MTLILIIIAVIIYVAVASSKEHEKNLERVNAIEIQQNKQKAYLEERGVVIRAEHISGNVRFIVDDVHRNVYVNPYGTNFVEIPFEDLTGCEITQNASTYETAKQGAVSRAVVGGILAGGAGAVIGAATAKEKVTTIPGDYMVTIYTRSIDHPQITITTKNHSFAVNVKGSVNAILTQSNLPLRRFEKRLSAPSDNISVQERPTKRALPEPEIRTWCIFCHSEISSSVSVCSSCKKSLTDNFKVISCPFCKKLVIKSDRSCKFCGCSLVR